MASSLQDILQAEFCPPLDSSLVAAILLDVDSNPTNDQLDVIRSQLRELAIQADAEQYSDPQSMALTEDTCSTPSFYHGESSSNGSDTLPLQSSFNSPLGFLQAALPHVQTVKLQRALSEADAEEREVDMWEIIAGILTDERIREWEERGLEGLEGDEMELDDWQTVEYTHKSKKAPPKLSTKKNRGKKITIVDIRQQQHVRPTPPTTPSESVHAAPDPWTQISSISEHLATLLPSHTVSFFQPYFHSPDYTTPYNALQAALAAIIKAHSPPSSSSVSTPYEDESKHDTILITLLDILLPSYEHLDSEARDRLIFDTELSISATGGRGAEALDLIKLLRDLDADSSSGYLEMGVYHQSPGSAAATSPTITPNSPSIPKSPWSQPTLTSTLPSGPPPVPPPPPSASKGINSASKRLTGNKPSPYQWQQVPQRKRPHNNAPHPLAIHIPAYSRDVNGFKVRGTGNGVGKGGKGDVGELGYGFRASPGPGSASREDNAYYQQRISEHMRQRDDMLRQASRMWQKGTAKSRGGEVAMYFAERAREFQEMARQDQLNAARAMVERKRLASQDHHTVDLHGTTVSEAAQIVKEMLSRFKCTPAQPLKIVTGRGAHSVGQVSVLKPALQKTLIEDGWSVSTWDAGLTVRGKRAG
ncbi:hypothetical protein VKT23_005037 [Stygiomarasmius scandens]|uniref:Smr domain-containing protein n=1 Tax=Marasmiellus scandens TaxID=2682957 RepID=A0ABR1JSX3_9AGAR